MEKTRTALQTIGRMLFTQCTEIINPATNRGLPPNLVGEEPTLSGIFKAIDIHIAALQSELGFLSAPVNHVQSAEMGNQALNSLALISARYTHSSINVLAELAAAHLLAVCQALDVRAMEKQFWDGYHPKFKVVIHQVLPIQKSDPQPASALERLLWQRLRQAFASTTHMDDDTRFEVLGESLRSPLMTHLSFKTFPNPLEALDGLLETLKPSLRAEWCQFRAWYIMHGDASGSLGRGTVQLFAFVRKTLEIPILSTSKIKTPDCRMQDTATDYNWSTKAPSVGSYTSVLHRALRDGTVVQPLMDVLKQVEENQ